MTMPLRPRKTPPLTLRGSIFSRSVAERLPRQQIAEPCAPACGHRAAQICGNLTRRAFGGLQRDIAGEAFGHDDVGRALADVVAFDEADVVEIAAAALAQHAAGLAHLLRAL